MLAAGAPCRRSVAARKTRFLSSSIGGLRRSSMLTPASCTHKLMMGWQVASSLKIQSIPRLGFASDSEKPAGGILEDCHYDSSPELRLGKIRSLRGSIVGASVFID